MDVLTRLNKKLLTLQSDEYPDYVKGISIALGTDYQVVETNLKQLLANLQPSPNELAEVYMEELVGDMDKLDMSVDKAFDFVSWMLVTTYLDIYGQYEDFESSKECEKDFIGRCKEAFSYYSHIMDLDTYYDNIKHRPNNIVKFDKYLRRENDETN